MLTTISGSATQRVPPPLNKTAVYFCACKSPSRQSAAERVVAGAFVSRYMVEEVAEDVGAGHNITHTCYMQSSSAGWARADGPAEFRPVGESEFVQGVAVQGESGRYGACRLGAGIVGTVDLSLGEARVEPVLREHQRVARNFRGVRFLGGQAESIQFDDPTVLGSLRVLERMGLTFDCNGPVRSHSRSPCSLASHLTFI